MVEEKEGQTWWDRDSARKMVGFMDSTRPLELSGHE
jgi:hypothetical protein